MGLIQHKSRADFGSFLNPMGPPAANGEATSDRAAA